MQSIKITKEYTFEEIKEEFKQKMQVACEEMQSVLKDLNTICNSLDLKVINMNNFSDNVGVSRRSLFLVDQILSEVMSSVEMLSQMNEVSNEAEAQEDDQAG